MPRGTAPWTWEMASLEGVTDGDTLDVKLKRDIGFHGEVWFVQRLRLNRIDAYKASTSLGDQGKAELFRLLSFRTLRVITLKPYKYGDEWMAEIFLSTDRNVSDWMVDQGFAVYWDGKGPRPAGLPWNETEWLSK